MKDLITEETEVSFNSEVELSYMPFIDGYIELYINGFYIGVCQIWYDSEMENREYIILNYSIIYLDILSLE